eukprot:scaffold29945_cov112-Isochrysis_galbana.AAC.4
MRDSSWSPLPRSPPQRLARGSRHQGSRRTSGGGTRPTAKPRRGGRLSSRLPAATPASMRGIKSTGCGRCDGPSERRGGGGSDLLAGLLVWASAVGFDG